MLTHTSTSSHHLPWPTALTGTASLAALERALAKGRLAHSLLLTSDQLNLVEETALALADRLLNPSSLPLQQRRPLSNEHHPDCFHLRPAGKSRQITADHTRELIGMIQVTASAGGQKVAILHECDRMNRESANIFLKTLEEPPPYTTLLLLTTRPHALLPTIRSRCQLFRFASTDTPVTIDGWPAWLDDYRAWLDLLNQGASRHTPDDAIFRLYGLIARFENLLETAANALWGEQKKSLPEEQLKEEKEALQTTLAKSLRDRMFADIERATGLYARERLSTPEAPAVARAYAEAVKQLERSFGLLNANFNDAAALELFLLQSLRAWSRK